MAPVTVLVLAPVPARDAGPLERTLDAARAALAEHHRRGFLAAGADAVVLRREPPDDTPFGARLRRLVAELRPAGLVVLGAGSIPLATGADLALFVEAAAAEEPGALANQRYSADVVAIARAGEVLGTCRISRRTTHCRAGSRGRRHSCPGPGVRGGASPMDIDSPLDLELIAGVRGAPVLPRPGAADATAVCARLAALRALAADPGAELLVAGRTSATDLRWLERHTRSRTRALIEERGLRTAGAGAQLGRPNRRPPRSVLGELLERDGPGSLGRHAAALADGALLDSRVLLAHRLGADERAWPSPEDRYASDLLLPSRIGDPWLRDLTAAALDAPVPILLGGHTLVGPGIRLALRR